MPKRNNLMVHYTYKDGVYDGELNILDGAKFDFKDIVIYILMEMDYDEKWIAKNFEGLTEESVRTTYAFLRGYRNDIYKIKQKRAMGRLMNAIGKSR